MASGIQYITTGGLAGSSQVREGLDEKKARLLQELEELKQAEEELRREEEVRDLECQVEAARRRVREQQAEIAHKRTRITSHSQERVPCQSPLTEDTSTACSSEPGLHNLKAPGTWTTAGHSHAYDSHAPDDSTASASSSNVHGSSGYRPAARTNLRKIETLLYYTDLDAHGDNQVLLLQEMDLEQLQSLLAKEEDAECNVEQAKSTSHAHYFIFLKTGAMDALERAIYRAKGQIPINSDSSDYAPRLKDLIVMLIKKYELTGSLDDLQEAILRAQEMIADTPLEHPNHSARISDWIKMMIHKCGRTGLQEDLDEAIIAAREAGAVISVNNSHNGGLMTLKVGIPM